MGFLSAVGRMCLTAELTIRYVGTVPDNQELTVVTEVAKANRRLVKATGEIQGADGKIYARAEGNWSFYYTAAGLHALHVIAGAFIMLIVAQTAKRNLELHRVELIGIYWHFVDLVWIFLFPLLYIAK